VGRRAAHPGGGVCVKQRREAMQMEGERMGVREDCTEVKGGVLFVKSCYL